MRLPPTAARQAAAADQVIGPGDGSRLPSDAVLAALWCLLAAAHVVQDPTGLAVLYVLAAAGWTARWWCGPLPLVTVRGSLLVVRRSLFGEPGTWYRDGIADARLSSTRWGTHRVELVMHNGHVERLPLSVWRVEVASAYVRRIRRWLGGATGDAG